MTLAALFLLAAASFHFDITDARGKKPPGVTVEARDADPDGWHELRLVNKGKGSPVLIWPFDSKAKIADGPGDIPVIVIETGDPKALTNTRVVAALVAGELLGASAALSAAEEPFARGVGLLSAKKPADAVDSLARALRERERQLTRVPSEVYPAAMLYGRALLDSGKFDDAAVAFLKALKQRPSDPAARQLRAEALIRAGKPEAQ